MRRWDYWVIITPVSNQMLNGRLAQRLHDRLVPKPERIKRCFYSRSAVRKALASGRSFTISVPSAVWSATERRRMIYDRNEWPRHGMPWKGWEW